MEQSLKQLVSQLEQTISGFEGGATKEKGKGVITSYKDGVIEIEGLKTLKMNEVVSIEGTNSMALVLNLELDSALAVVLNKSPEIKEGLYVQSTGETLKVPVSDDLIGRVLDPLGRPQDGKPEIKAKDHYNVEKLSPGVIERQSVDEPVQTGILAIDALIPIGRGQRELIIGDRQTGKTAVAIDTIINQRGQDMICIYVSVGQRESKLAQVIRTLQDKGAMDYTIVVSASASESAVLQYLAPLAGAAMGEYFMDQAKDVLIVYDDLSKQAVAYREMSLLLRRPPGREAYPGDVFYLHSRLLERAARRNKDYGGGSMTALPIIETQAGDVSAYIPTNVISITDGQIYLETELFNKGIRPAINAGISVSRVGGSAQTKLIKKVAGRVKLSLTQYYELEAFSQFASDLDADTKAQLVRGRRVVEALKQKENSPYALWEEAVIIVAANEGHLDQIDESECPSVISGLLSHVSLEHKDFIALVEKEKAYTEEIEKQLAEILEGFFKNY